MRVIAVCWIFFLGAHWLDAQAVLSRRVYAAHGRTWRQLWIASAGSTNFRQLTHSARDHAEPFCSRDGELIYFVSDPDASRSLNAYAGANDRELWAYNRRTGQERRLWQTSDADGLHLNGTTAEGGVLIRVGTELSSLARYPWAIDKIDPAYNAAAVSPDGRSVAIVIAESLDKDGQSHDAKLFIVDAATGRSRVLVGKYEVPTWSPAGKRIAAVGEHGLTIIDAATLSEVSRPGSPKSDRVPEDLVWSPDEKYLLAGIYGDAAGSGDPQRDYFLLNIATGTWTPAVTAQQALWLPGNVLLYLRPIGMNPTAPGSRHQVWTAQLAAFDLAARRDNALTRGLVLNDSLSSCGR